MTDAPPHIKAQLNDLMRPMIETAYPIPRIEVPTRVLLMQSKKPNRELQEALSKNVNTKISELVDLLYSEEGQHFFTLLAEYMKTPNEPSVDDAEPPERLSASDIKIERQKAILARIQEKVQQAIADPDTLSATDLLCLIDLFTPTGMMENTWTECLTNASYEIANQSLETPESIDGLLKIEDLFTPESAKGFARDVLEKRFGYMLRNNQIRGIDTPTTTGIDSSLKDFIGQMKDKPTLKDALELNDGLHTFAQYCAHLTGKQPPPTASAEVSTSNKNPSPR